MGKSYERYRKNNQNEIIGDIKTESVKRSNYNRTSESKWRSSRVG